MIISSNVITDAACPLGVVGHLVDLAQPGHAPARGQPSTNRYVRRLGSAPGLGCGSPRGGRWDASPHPAPPWQFSWRAIPETCPPGEGMIWLDLLR
ncbi:MAG TPA: hypothetical protein VJT72_19190 [Pseudonocardiaceae bacterium]|nr:hypothetical protein [Pseudonocardiaceae bacterium]